MVNSKILFRTTQGHSIEDGDIETEDVQELLRALQVFQTLFSPRVKGPRNVEKNIFELYTH